MKDGWGHAKEDIGRITKITEVKEDGENTNYKIDPPLNSNCADSTRDTNHQNSYKLSTREAFEQDQIEHCGFKVGDRVEYIHEDYGVYGGSKYDLNGDTIGTVQDIMWSEAFDKVKIYVLFPNVSGKWACDPSEIKKKEIEIHDGHTMSTKRDTHKHTGGSEKYIVGSSIPKKDSWSEHVVRHAIDASKYGIKLDPIPYPWAEEPVIPKGSWLHVGVDPYEDDTEFKLQTHKKLDIF